MKEIKEINKFLQHLPTCNLMQDWSEAADAVANTPQQFRDEGYCEAVQEMENKRRQCTCGLNEIKKDMNLIQAFRNPLRKK